MPSGNIRSTIAAVTSPPRGSATRCRQPQRLGRMGRRQPVEIGPPSHVAGLAPEDRRHRFERGPASAARRKRAKPVISSPARRWNLAITPGGRGHRRRWRDSSSRASAGIRRSGPRVRAPLRRRPAGHCPPAPAATGALRRPRHCRVHRHSFARPPSAASPATSTVRSSSSAASGAVSTTVSTARLIHCAATSAGAHRASANAGPRPRFREISGRASPLAAGAAWNRSIGHDSPGDAPGSGAVKGQQVSSFERVSRRDSAPMGLAWPRHGHSAMASLSRQQGSLAGRSLADQQCGVGGDERP